MSTRIHTDLVPLLSDLVNGLQAYAKAQEIVLIFVPFISTVRTFYYPEKLLSEFTVLLSRIITFTPQSNTVKVSLSACNLKKGHYVVSIENSGVDLSKLGEILSSVKNGLLVERLNRGTRFKVSIPKEPITTISADQNNMQNLLPKQYPNYYAAIAKRLTTYFSNTENMEKAAALKSFKEGVFLKKVNVVLQSHLSDPDFKVDTLADAMALSRTQLFRKIKALTQMSPQQYLRFVRLEKAKKLLQSKDEDLNVSEVCYEVGFASKSHFTRSFQKEFGFNPSEFIKGKM